MPGGPDAFAAYLDAKFDLDERSLAREVRDECFARLAGRSRLRCADVGTGTGAMVRRVLDAASEVATIEIDAIDRDAALLARARERLCAHLAQRGFTRIEGDEDGSGSRCPDSERLEARELPKARERLDERECVDAQGCIDAWNARRRVAIRLVRCDVLRRDPVAAGTRELVTAHAFMDLVPMRPLLERFAGWLAPGGLLYATLNYDGRIMLVPACADAGFEAELLRRYDTSMEARRVDGQATGGAWSGRRLHAMLPEAGFEVVACARSDWNALPCPGRLRPDDAVVVSTLLEAIRRENEAFADPGRLAAWWSARRTQLETGTLGVLVHQLDLLGVRR